jgi:pilus assembly protein CpaE
VEDLPQVAQHLQAMLAREKEVELAGAQSEPEAAIAQIATEKPDIVMIDALLQGKVPAMDIARRVRAVSPGTRIVMVTVPQKLLDAKAMATVDGVFVLPGGANELAQVLGVAKLARPLRGLMMAVYSPKGGIGKTTLAVNLACVLRRQGKSVVLVDGVMQFGAVRHVMQVPPATRSFVDLPTAGAMRTTMNEVLWEGPSGIHVLLAPQRPEEADLVQGPDIANAMNMLAENHDYVIVAANVILMVVSYMNATVANSRSAIDTFEALGYKGSKPILLVVNQADTAGGMSKTAVEHALNLPIIAEIPTDWKTVSDSLNKQQPFVISSPQSAVSRAVEALAQGVITQQRK